MELAYQIFRYAMGVFFIAAGSCAVLNAFIEKQDKKGVPALRKSTAFCSVFGILACIGYAVLYGMMEG